MRTAPLDLKATCRRPEVLAALAVLDRPARRGEILDFAIDRYGWTSEELLVPSRWGGSSPRTQVRAAYDYSFDNLAKTGRILPDEPGVRDAMWQLASAEPLPAIDPLPSGQVFVCAVGRHADAVDDGYDVTAQPALWFRRRSSRVMKGAHVFAIAAGRNGAVLGLARITDTAMRATPTHPTNPERWRWALSIEWIAGGPARLAPAQAGLQASQGSSLDQPRAELLPQLYAAVEHLVLDREDGTPDGVPPTANGNQALNGRRSVSTSPFDPTRRPKVPAIASPGPYDARTIQRLEQACGKHHDLLCVLHAALVARGWTEIGEDHGATDLHGRPFESDVRVRFEAKTLTPANHLAASRAGLAQLLEYRHFDGDVTDVLCLVCDQPLDPTRAELLDALGVGVLNVHATGVAVGNRRAHDLGLHRHVLRAQLLAPRRTAADG